MIQKVITKRELQDSSVKQDLAYWLSKTIEERVEAVDFLRRQYNGYPVRLQRVVRVIKRKQR